MHTKVCSAEDELVQVLDLCALTNCKACNVILDSLKQNSVEKNPVKLPLCVPTLTSFMIAGNGKEHTDKGKKKEKLELLHSFLNTGLYFSMDHLVHAMKNR